MRGRVLVRGIVAAATWPQVRQNPQMQPRASDFRHSRSRARSALTSRMPAICVQPLDAIASQPPADRREVQIGGRRSANRQVGQRYLSSGLAGRIRCAASKRERGHIANQGIQRRARRCVANVPLRCDAMASKGCTHIAGHPGRHAERRSAAEECLKIGSPWTALRILRTCATSAAATIPRTSTRPRILCHRPSRDRRLHPPEGWGCAMSTSGDSICRSEKTPHNVSIPRYY